MDVLLLVKENLLEKENFLSIYATKSKDAIRIIDKKEDIRPAFFHDIDTIIHSTSYSRYIDKTQVFSFNENDNISKRMIHVQLVSKVARTIGRALNLNEDLIEAIALGHDIGHTPLGHVGEKILNDISLKELKVPFMHNLQSVRTFMTLKDDNLTIQVLDGIMCHNGEILDNVYEPKKKSKEEFLEDYKLACESSSYAKKLRPMTLEGCVVRISDIIAYIGRDIEDAIRIGKLQREIIPKNIKNVLGSSNREIINTIILDIIKNSYGKDKIILSKDVFASINNLKKFNYKEIYEKANTKEELKYYENGMKKLYYYLLDDLNNNKNNSVIYKVFINNMPFEYINKNDNKRIVIDFIAGMTDDYFLNMLKLLTKND